MMTMLHTSAQSHFPPMWQNCCCDEARIKKKFLNLLQTLVNYFSTFKNHLYLPTTCHSDDDENPSLLTRWQPILVKSASLSPFCSLSETSAHELSYHLSSESFCLQSFQAISPTVVKKKQYFLDSGIFPMRFGPSRVENYRPILLFPFLSSVLECALVSQSSDLLPLSVIEIPGHYLLGLVHSIRTRI